MGQVSRKIEGGIQSAYYDLDYKPSEDRSNSDLNRKCSSLIVAMGIADATRESRHIESLMKVFCETLLMCKTQEELSNFDLFMNKLADIGGLAKGFYSEVKVMINQQGKTAAQNIVQNIDKEKRDETSGKDSSKLREFEQIYAQLNNELNKFRSKPMVNDRDLNLLLEMYQKLSNYLHRLKGTIDDGIFSQYDGQINNVIHNLNSMAGSLGELERPIRR